MRVALASCSVILLLAVVGAEAATPPPIEGIVKEAIENFQPLWSPPAGELRGRVIGIDSVLVGPAEVSGQLADDLGLVTAAHLYHLVLKAGGSPVLTRADATLAADVGQPACDRRFEVVRERACNLCVSIRYVVAEGGSGVGVQAVGDRPDDRNLAGALRAALGVDVAGSRSHTNALADELGRIDGTGRIAMGLVDFGFSKDVVVIDAAMRKLCFENARRVYQGVRQHCQQAVSEADGSAEPAPTPSYPISSVSTRVAQRARSIWPDGRLPSERLEWFCRVFTQMSVTNRTLVCMDVSPRLEGDVTVLRGRTNIPRVAEGLVEALRAVGVEPVRNEVRSLPDRERLGEHAFGVCRVPTALTYDRPGGGGGLQTQLLFGEPVFLLDRDGEHTLLHAADGYWGWVHHAALATMTGDAFDAYMKRPCATVACDIRIAGVMIPRGALVRVVSADKSACVLQLPDGATLPMPAAWVSVSGADETETARGVRAALELLYAPYVFGGRSPLGLDCSGLMTSVLAQAGCRPSRDAWQQALSGRLVAVPWHRTGIQMGDQLFFINASGKVYHTGVALDATHVLHASPPCVQIGSLDPDDRLYNAELDQNFFMAKRP